MVPTSPRSRGCLCPWFPLASVPDFPSYNAEFPSQVALWLVDTMCVPKMTGPLEPRLLGPRRGLPRAGSTWGLVTLPEVATLPAPGSTSFLEGVADGLAPLAEVGMDQIIPVLCHFYQMLQRENRLIPMIV